ncbi:MAG: BTAD domain-containing putative transcriptional regulator, partial [Eubacterium sp.]
MSVKIGDDVVFGNDDRLKTHWKLLAFLLLYKNKSLTNQMMIDMLYDNEHIDNTQNALKNIVYYLRKDLGSNNNFIGVCDGDYRWNPEADLYLDTDEFERLMVAIQNSQSIEKKLALYKRVLEVYSGDLLSQIANEPWVVELSGQYKKNYLDMMENYLELLMEQEEYEQVLSVSDIVTSIEPLEERIYLYMFRALSLCNMNGIISEIYLKLSRMFMDELDMDLCIEIHEIYKEATRKINSIEKDITIIKEDLKEVTKDQVPIRGAYL